MYNRVKEFRLEKKLSQAELANKANLSRYLISMIENRDDLNLTKNTMVSIANVLGKKVTDIFFDM